MIVYDKCEFKMSVTIVFDVSYHILEYHYKPLVQLEMCQFLRLTDHDYDVNLFTIKTFL